MQDASDIADMHRVQWRDSGVADEWMEVASDDVFLVVLSLLHDKKMPGKCRRKEKLTEKRQMHKYRCGGPCFEEWCTIGSRS